jgi:O-methyltransferase/aklanonic acid methyltransferase
MDTVSYKSDVTNVFNRAAATYDRSGVEFFTPMGRRLVELVAPQAGSSVLDIGCGRGACLFPAAAAVGPTGRLVGIDIAPAMIEEARRESERLELGNVELLVMDAEEPQFAPATFDFVTGSYSIIFLPNSIAALAKFRKLLVPGGKLGFTSPVIIRDTFSFLPPLFADIITDDVLRHVPEEWRPRQLVERYYLWLADSDKLVATLAAAGFDNVVIHDEPVRMVTESGRDWVAWSRTQGMRLLWNNLPEQEQGRLETSIITELDARRTGDGLITMEMPVRYVTADAAGKPVNSNRDAQ